MVAIRARRLPTNLRRHKPCYEWQLQPKPTVRIMRNCERGSRQNPLAAFTDLISLARELAGSNETAGRRK